MHFFALLTIPELNLTLLQLSFFSVTLQTFLTFILCSFFCCCFHLLFYFFFIHILLLMCAIFLVNNSLPPHVISVCIFAGLRFRQNGRWCASITLIYYLRLLLFINVLFASFWFLKLTCPLYLSQNADSFFY